MGSSKFRLKQSRQQKRSRALSFESLTGRLLMAGDLDVPSEAAAEVASDYGTDPYGSDYGTDAYGTDAYGTDSSGTDPYGTEVYGTEVYGTETDGDGTDYGSDPYGADGYGDASEVMTLEYHYDFSDDFASGTELELNIDWGNAFVQSHVFDAELNRVCFYVEFIDNTNLEFGISISNGTGETITQDFDDES